MELYYIIPIKNKLHMYSRTALNIKVGNKPIFSIVKSLTIVKLDT